MLSANLARTSATSALLLNALGLRSALRALGLLVVAAAGLGAAVLAACLSLPSAVMRLLSLLSARRNDCSADADCLPATASFAKADDRALDDARPEIRLRSANAAPVSSAACLRFFAMRDAVAVARASRCSLGSLAAGFGVAAGLAAWVFRSAFLAARRCLACFVLRCAAIELSRPGSLPVLINDCARSSVMLRFNWRS